MLWYGVFYDSDESEARQCKNLHLKENQVTKKAQAFIFSNHRVNNSVSVPVYSFCSFFIMKHLGFFACVSFGVTTILTHPPAEHRMTQDQQSFDNSKFILISYLIEMN